MVPRSHAGGSRACRLTAVAGAALASLTVLASAAAARPVIAPPSRSEGATVARIVTPVFARARLDQPRHGQVVSPQTSWSGEATVLLVLASETAEGSEWLEVLLPDRPDGSKGWIPRNAAVLGHSPYWIQVSTRARRVQVFRSGRRVRAFGAVVGKPSTPTPLGLAAIYERARQSDPHDFVGSWVLALTALSDVLKHFEGGPGRIGIHGRGGASLLDPLGSARSHGCIRISNGPVDWMAAHVPLGTPVSITA